MWTWELERRRQAEEPAVQLGEVTLSGGETAANLGGERRWLQVCAPGGCSWRPRQGERTLILKAGDEVWVLGAAAEPQLQPGQVKLTGTGCTLFLGDKLEITGGVDLNGQSLEDHIRAIVAEILSGG